MKKNNEWEIEQIYIQQGIIDNTCIHGSSDPETCRVCKRKKKNVDRYYQEYVLEDYILA